MLILKRLLRILIFFLAVILLINIIPAGDAISVNPFSKTEDIIIATQSGGGPEYPQNVMNSFNAASYYGIMYFSVGVYMTADEVLIIADNDALSESTGFDGKISESTYDELTALNFAYNFSNDGASFPYRDQIVNCVKLEDFFDNFPYSNYIVEINQQGEEGLRAAVLLCEMIRQKQLSMRVVVKGDTDVINYARSYTNSAILTEPFDKELTRFSAYCKLFIGNLYTNIEFQFVEIPVDEIDKYSRLMLASLKHRNVSIFVSGVDSEEDLKKAVEISPDGIITETPKTILNLIDTYN